MAIKVVPYVVIEEVEAFSDCLDEFEEKDLPSY